MVGRQGRSEGLSAARITRAAAEIADAEGLAALSMRRVATALQVEAMSLYHHVEGKEGLLDAMVDAVYAQFHDPRPGADWRAEMGRRNEVGRKVLRAHPWAVGLLDSRRSPGPATLRHHDATLGCLRGAGFSLELAGHAVALLDAHLFGQVIQEVSLPFQGEQELAELAGDVLAALPDGELVHFREYAVGRALQPGYDFADEFDWGLELVLDGIARRRAAED